MGIEFAIPALDYTEAYRTDLPVASAMLQFKHEPTMRSVLTGGNATIQCTGEKTSLQQDPRHLLIKIGPLLKFGVLPS